MTNEVMMIPTQEFERLQDFYKGQISQSTLLNKAGRLAAEKHLILKNPKIPAATAVKMIKPLAREQARLTKRIRLGNIPPQGVGAPDPDEQETMVDAPLENLLKKLIKQRKPTPVTPRPSRMKMEPATPGPSGVKPPVPPKPPGLKTSSTSEKKSGGFKKAALSGAAKGFLKSVGIDPKFIDDDDDDDDYDETPKGAKGKQPKKIKKTEADRLAEGWEEWDRPTKRKLSYGKTNK